MTEKPRETQAESHVVELKEKVNNSSLMKHRQTSSGPKCLLDNGPFCPICADDIHSYFRHSILTYPTRTVRPGHVKFTPGDEVIRRYFT